MPVEVVPTYATVVTMSPESCDAWFGMYSFISLPLRFAMRLYVKGDQRGERE